MYCLFIFLLFGASAMAQDNFNHTVKEYYRVDPFAGSFSAFVKALTTDTALHNKVILKQTDTTGFYVKGEYDIFNPFSIDARKVDMLFYENQKELSDKFIMTFYVYQLTAYFPDTEANRKVIKKDYSRLVRMVRKDLYIVNKQSLKGYEAIADGEISFFTDNDFFIKPAVVSWQTLEKTKQLALTFVINIRQVDNRSFPVNRVPVF